MNNPDCKQAGSAAVALVAATLALVAGFALAWLLKPAAPTEPAGLASLQADLDAKQAEVDVLERVLAKARAELDTVGGEVTELRDRLVTKTGGSSSRKGAEADLASCQLELMDMRRELRTYRDGLEQAVDELNTQQARAAAAERHQAAPGQPTESGGPATVYVRQPKLVQGDSIAVTGTLHNVSSVTAAGLPKSK